MQLARSRAASINWCASFAAVLMLAATSRAQSVDDIPDEQLTPARLVGDSAPTASRPERPQLVQHDRTPVTVAGVTTAVLGAVGLVSGWAVYVARQNYRLRPWSNLDHATVNEWETQGEWAFWLTAGSSTLLITSEYLLLPEDRGVPTLAWLGGVGGLVTAAVGIGYAVGGSHCAPQAATPGAQIIRDCLSGTSDALLGPMLLLSSAPLLNIPLVYLLRPLFAGAPEPLSFTPTGVAVRLKF